MVSVRASGRTTKAREGHLVPGCRVRVATRPALGHCRTPWYLRGKTGVVVQIQGTFPNPELLAYHKPGLPHRVVYKVRFEQREIWDRYEGFGGDLLEADIYEHWLEALR